jgi:16S rRNA (guanine966-N2)-methyltransferase
MRIIAGKHKGRKIQIPNEKAARPTRPLVREAIFNILNSGEFLNKNGISVIQDATILDLFAGSGSFAIEALSRGAQKAILVDKNKANLNIARSNIASIGELENAVFIGCDIEHLSAAKVRADIVFIDPPYHQGLVEIAIKRITLNNWLKNGSVIIIESDVRDLYDMPNGFYRILHKEYGSTKIDYMLFTAS